MKLLSLRSRLTGWRLAAGVGGAGLLAAAGMMVPASSSASVSAPHSDHSDRSGWVATWAAAPVAGTDLESPTAHAGFADQTVRNIIYTSVGGNELRVRLSNTFGTTPLKVGAVSVGEVLDGAQLLSGSAHAVTFGGKSAVTIPPGAEVLSDPVAIKVAALQELAVSLYLPGPTGRATNHLLAQQTGYIAAGDHAGDASASAYTTTDTSWFYVDSVDVYNPVAAGTIVAFGDSITDGKYSGLNTNARWPNYLARRLHAVFGDRTPGVVDEGIAGNRVLNNSACFGPSALARFEQDALSQPGVKAVIFLEGINDIGFSAEPDTGCHTPNDSTVTAAQIETGYRKLIAMAHARGVRIYAGTLTPFAGSHPTYGGNYGTAYGEALRQQVNTWILTSHAFDGVINFSRLTQDPADPLYLNPVYNSGESLHPNDVGYQAMADAIPLRFVR